MAISFAILSQANHFSILLIGLAVMALGFGLVNCYLPALLTTYCNEENRGSVMGIYESISSLSRIIGPLFVYAVFFSSIKMGYLWFSIILLILCPFFLVFYRQSQQ